VQPLERPLESFYGPFKVKLGIAVVVCPVGTTSTDRSYPKRGRVGRPRHRLGNNSTRNHSCYLLSGAPNSAPNTLLYKISMRSRFDGIKEGPIHNLDRRPKRSVNRSAHWLMPPLRRMKVASGSALVLYFAAYLSARDHLDRVRLSTF
jgi:hypothetical protein